VEVPRAPTIRDLTDAAKVADCIAQALPPVAVLARQR